MTMILRMTTTMMMTTMTMKRKSPNLPTAL